MQKEILLQFFPGPAINALDYCRTLLLTETEPELDVILELLPITAIFSNTSHPRPVNPPVHVGSSGIEYLDSDCLVCLFVGFAFCHFTSTLFSFATLYVTFGNGVM